jgi:hypothetical protein
VSNSSDSKRVERDARLRWVPIPKMKVSPLAQRELNQARVDHIAASFNPEEIGTPTVNERGDAFYIIDGQHRVEALKQIGWGDQQIQCWTYVGLTEEEEAEKFLRLNDTLAVNAISRYRVGVQAGRDEECDIDRIVRAAGLVVTLDSSVPGSIGAVGTLRRVYDRADGATLGRTLRLARDAFGDPGLVAPVIDGLGLLCQRYNGQLEDAAAVQRFQKLNGGVNGLLGTAERIRRSTGSQKNHAVAAAAVEILNTGRGGKKLPSWWKDPA